MERDPYHVNGAVARYVTQTTAAVSVEALSHITITLTGGMGDPVVLRSSANVRHVIDLRGDVAVAAIADGLLAGLDVVEAVTEYVNGAGAPLDIPLFTFNAIGNEVTGSEDTPARMSAVYEGWDVPTAVDVGGGDAASDVTRVYGRTADRPLVKAARYGRPDAKPEGTAARCGACAAREPAFLCTGCRAATYCGTSCQRAAWDAHAEMCG